MGRTTIQKKTDYGTVILHWLLVAMLAVATATGLRIASETPDRVWINALDALLPKATVWTHHVDAAVVLIAVAIAYVIYLRRAGLSRRVRLDRVRLAGLIGRPQARWGAINVLLYWGFYTTMLSQLMTGIAIYLGFANHAMVEAHWLGMWAILAYAPVHVLSQWQLGGKVQLLRILRPARLMPPPAPFDPAEVLELLAREKTDRRDVASDQRPPRRVRADRSLPADRPHVVASRPPHAPTGHGPAGRHQVLQANPFIVSAAAALVGVGFLLAVERQTTDALYIRRVDPAEAPVIDGETSDAVWRRAPAVTVLTEHGGNFQGRGETPVTIQAVHDGTYAYFLFMWDDATRSLKQLPLRKTAKGWQLLHDGFEYADERAYNEDKFAVLLTKLDAVLAGDLTFHAGPEPAAGKPRTLSGRGLHYTSGESVYVDVWQWKATSTNPTSYCDDDHFGPPGEGTKAQFDGTASYRGGFAPDPGSASYQDNFALLWPSAYAQGVTPRRLPKNVGETAAALGLVDLDPDHGESESARWSMTEEESVPYSAELDRLIPEGTIIPGVILSGKYAGDRADVRCAARWHAGRWALEAVRRMAVDSPYDVAIASGTYMRVAAFDHTQIRHTRHVRPLRLEVQ
jgi:hypothetical protein